MSARNMVRNLRDSGALGPEPGRQSWRTGVIFFLAAIALGAGVYLGALYGLPALIQMMDVPAPIPEFDKPGAG